MTDQKPSEQARREVWEYKLTGNVTLEALKALGKEGWMGWAITQYETGNSIQHIYWRRVAAPEPAQQTDRNAVLEDLKSWAAAHESDAKIYLQERGADWQSHVARHQASARALRAAISSQQPAPKDEPQCTHENSRAIPDSRGRALCNDCWKIVPDKFPKNEPQQQGGEITCKFCNGAGMVADYIGDEMICIGVECEQCKGSGKIVSRYASVVDDAAVERAFLLLKDLGFSVKIAAVHAALLAAFP